MPRINADNLFGFTDYVVDPSAAHGSFTTIQSAIDALDAAGNFGCILIRPGNYTENLVLKPNQQILATDVDGRLQNATPVVITGTHTLQGDGAGGQFAATLMQGIFFNSFADTFTIISDGPNGIIFALKFCQVACVAGSAMNISTVGAGTFALGVIFESELNAGVDGFQIAANCAARSILGNIQASNNAVTLLGSGASFVGQYSEISGTVTGIDLQNAANNVNIIYCSLFSNGPTIKYTAAGSVNASHCMHRTSNGTGFYVDGGAGSYTYSDDTLEASAVNIAAGITQTTNMWRPTAITAATSADVRRGTTSFDNTQFTSTDGFIQLINGLSGFTWIDRALPAIVASFTGNFFTAATTLTLPLAPSQGDEVKFACDTAGPCIIQANGAQVIRVGINASAAGGAATSTAQGNTLDLVYRAVAGEWISIATDGNWLII